jgi:UDP-3-O-[3-hydroxymyristoyl] N-acetylglucosamine deacetylase/3-hydroxyacyl-[acyl-carrier-protein] dehydratase
MEYRGVGLHRGEEVRLRFKPAPAGSGIVFRRVDLPGAPRVRASIESSEKIPRRTTLREGDAAVETVEHLLAAVAGLGISDMEVDIDGREVPGADGSALAFCEILEEAGVREIEGWVDRLFLRRPVLVADGSASILALPATEGLHITYCLDYEGTPIPPQRFAYTASPESFARDVAGARTFCLQSEAERLLAAGLGKGASYENTLVLGPDGPIQNRFRLASEPARHKLLDLLGDLALLEADLCARILAWKSGHDLNRRLVEAIARNSAPDEGGARGRTLAEFLPGRHPDLLFDGVTVLDATQAEAVWRPLPGDPVFQGLFARPSLLPEMYVIEALAQLAGIQILAGRMDLRGRAVLRCLTDGEFGHTVAPGEKLVLCTSAENPEETAIRIRCRMLHKEGLVAAFVLHYEVEL